MVRKYRLVIKGKSYKMKILIISDSHGYNKNVKTVIDLEKPDMLIHCGDVEGSEAEIEKLAGAPRTPCVFVKGNCDWGSTNQTTRKFTLCNHNFLITHGHVQGIHSSDDALKLKYLAESNECDIVCFGHIHVPVDEQDGNIRILNPGSISRPRGGRKPTYLILYMTEDGMYTVEKKMLQVEE